MKLIMIGIEEPSIYRLRRIFHGGSGVREIRLEYSKFGDWTESVKGTVAASVTQDDGTVRLRAGGHYCEIGYSDAVALHAALSEWARTQKHIEITRLEESK